MPYLKIQTNQFLAADSEAELLQKASTATALALGKPESYVMVALESGCPMLFAGSDAPLAYLELKSIGLSEDDTGNISAALCQLIGSELGIEQKRIYIEFSNAQRHLWGWNGATF